MNDVRMSVKETTKIQSMARKDPDPIEAVMNSRSQFQR
jgi:hypothetical protein